MPKKARPNGHWKTLSWGNPYTDPPEGFERIQMQLLVEKPNHEPPEMLARQEELGRLHGKPWTFKDLATGEPKQGLLNPWWIRTTANMPEPRRLKLRSKQKIRRKRLWRRLSKKHPLFAEQWYVEEVEKRRDYFGVHTKKIPVPPK